MSAERDRSPAIEFRTVSSSTWASRLAVSFHTSLDLQSLVLNVFSVVDSSISHASAFMNWSPRACSSSG